jgi:hypothetical protein
MQTHDLVLLALRRTRRYQKSGAMTPDLRRARATLAEWLRNNRAATSPRAWRRSVEAEEEIRIIAEAAIDYSRR